jgi:hypothetical protein
VKVAVHDVAALRALRPLDVAAYLRTQGWAVDGTIDAFTRYIHGSNGDRVDIEVPRGTEYRDFHLRMAEVVNALAQVEQRSQLEILEDLSVAGADVIRIRLHGTDVNDGTVTLEDGAAVVDRVRDVMLASACAAVEPRAFFGTRKPTEATEYVRKLRLGQTEHGSFVVKVLSPVAPLLSVGETGDLFPESLVPPFERKVTETLMSGARAASHAALDAGAKGTLTPFEKAVALGSSANLCEGLAGILVDRPYTALEVSMTWSRNRPAPTTVDRVVRLTKETAPVLASAARELKARAPRDDFDLAGYVVALDNPNVRQHGGTITVAAAVDTGARRVRVALGAEDYKRAIEAHKAMARVTCSGRLVKAGRQYELQGPSGFTVIGDD